MAMTDPVCRPPGAMVAAGGPAPSAPTDAVVEDQEREAEHAERVLGPELPVVDVDVELLGEAMDGQRGQLPGVGVDEREVVAGVLTARPDS